MSGNQGKPPANASFLDLYLWYTRKQESPQLFHLWTGLTLIGAALGRKCYMNRGYYRLYPNVFCILVAGAAECRKSTAIEIGIQLLDDIPSLVQDVPSIKVFDGKISPEKFIRDIAESTALIDGEHVSPSILVWADELSVFLSKQSYAEPLINILTRLFSCPTRWSYKTKNKGEDILHNIFISIIAATTPKGVAKGIPQSAMDEGWGSRCIFVFQDYDPEREELFPEITDEDLAIHLELKKRLASIAIMRGEFQLTKDARAWAKDWYHKHRNDRPTDELLGGMHGRKHDHMFRVAMMLAGSQLVNVVDESHLDAAVFALDAIEKLAPKAFVQMGSNEMTTHVDKVRSIMRKYKRMQISELMRRTYPVTAPDFKVILDTLGQQGEIKWEEDERGLRTKILIWIGE